MTSDAPTHPRRWLGTELDLHAVGRDAVLAGVFSGLNVLAGTLDPLDIPAGLAFGAGIGAILHLMPAEPRATDERLGRVLLRGISGFVGGAWAGVGVAVVASGAFVNERIDPPTASELVPHAVVGALTGLAWYVAWGFWEMRPGGRRS